MSKTKKPFFLKPPWNILFEINRLEKLTPWSVNIAYLLRSFLSEMENTGEVDFRASGVALDSSALIYLMKSKLLLILQESPEPQKPPTGFIPPPLFLPLRQELTSTTIQNLLDVLDEVLKGEKIHRLDRIAAKPVLPLMSDILPQFQVFLHELESEMDKLYELLCEKVKGTGIIEFAILIKGKLRLEAINTFILLLFLAQVNKVNLWQNEETEELYIAVGDLNFGKEQTAIN
jgi:chromatin segregation and condensation protein Rec8/ScpA/Scc1 (kleisin family)